MPGDIHLLQARGAATTGTPRPSRDGGAGGAHFSVPDFGLRQVYVCQRMVFPVDAAAAIPRARTAIGMASLPYGPSVGLLFPDFPRSNNSCRAPFFRYSWVVLTLFPIP